jgi:3-phenylpropionate/trans-cinnamate dioxygenase ferredoxin reductase subunit
MSKPTFVIAGAGLAGAKAAQTLREEGFTGAIQLVGDELERPYERPPLSKGYLSGTAERGSIFVHEASWYDDNDVELRLGSAVVQVDPNNHEVHLATGEPLHYSRLLIATGSSPRRLRGTDLRGLYYLRDVDDADQLRAALSTLDHRRVLVVGAGWIGMETAAAARRHGHEVTVLDPNPTPLLAALGGELGEMFADLHREHGVSLRLSTHVRDFISSDGRVTGLITDNDETLPADLVVVGVGARPRIEIAERAGLKIDNGIVVDETLRSSDQDIYAAGDVANSFHPRIHRHLRVEHWANALHSGPAAAKSMLGQDVVYDPVPYFYTDQYDLGMEYSGHAGPGTYDRVVIRGDRRAREFIAFWLAGDRIVAGMNVNVWDVTSTIQALIRSNALIDVDQLIDTDIPLTELAPLTGVKG